MSARAWKIVAWSVLPPLGAFVALMSAAAALYPGGTWEDPQEVGYSWVRSYFCDLLRPVALNGAPNPTGAALAEWGLLAFAVALCPFFLVAPRTFPERPRLGKVVRWAGAMTSAGAVGIVLFPSYRVGSLVHGLVILLAAGPGLTAAICAAAGARSARARAPLLSWLSTATLALTALIVVVFSWQLAIRVETTPGLAVMQKLAMGLAVVWMVLTVIEVVRGGEASGAREGSR